MRRLRGASGRFPNLQFTAAGPHDQFHLGQVLRPRTVVGTLNAMTMNDAALTATVPGLERPVLIADDHLLVRDGLKLLVSSILGPVQFLEASDAESLLKMAGVLPQARVALVDLNMPGMGRGARLAELAHRHPTLPVVIISALTSPDVVRRALDISTVFAFVPKSATADHMGAAIAAAINGVKLPFAQVNPGSPDSDVALPPRLEEIRQLLRQGMSNKLIASKLGISEGTVKNYMSDIFRALKVTNRTQAARFDNEAA